MTMSKFPKMVAFTLSLLCAGLALSELSAQAVRSTLTNSQFSAYASKQATTGSVVHHSGQAVGSLKVMFIRDGEVVFSEMTDEAGGFQVPALSQGIYTFAAIGNTGIAVHGFVVRPEDQILSDPNRTIEFAVVAPDFDGAVSFLRANQFSDGASTGVDIMPQETNNSLLVQLGENGSLHGHMVPVRSNADAGQDFSTMAARVFRQNEVVSDVHISASGEFLLENLEPGIYDFVASGRQGVVVMSFEAIANDAFTAIDDGQNQFASAKRQLGDQELEIFVAPSTDIRIIFQQFDEFVDDDEFVEFVIEEPLMDDGFVGESIAYGADAGLGGGGGGFGDMGGLVNAALAAWVLTEIVDQIDNDDRPRVIVPPIVIPNPNSPFKVK